MQIMRVGFGFTYLPARYWGWRHCLHVGWWLILWGQLADGE